MENVNQLRIDLAAAYRWAVRFGLHEGISNHFSVALDDDTFLINPHWSEITASSILICDVDGKVLEGDHPVEPTALFIHGQTHRAAPHAKVVLHTHMPYATAITMLEGGRIEPVEQNAIRFHNKIAYDDEYNGLALDEEEGLRIASKLGNNKAIFLANHGVVVVGPNVAEAFDDLYYLERAAMVQVLAQSTGKPFRRIPKKIVETTIEQMSGECETALLHFEALKRILNKEEPDYVN
jgi:ribulose-5-phosphate 4-epimerase/fuculose-1-phosphate aldolase